MKKVLFAMSMASVVLASCSSEEPMEVNNGRAIEFRHGIASRAAITTTGNLSEFKATAILGDGNYFTNLLFAKKDGESTFTSALAYYWPGDDSELKFYAYSPVSLNGTVAIAANAQTLTGFTTATDLAAQVDFISAVATGKKSTNEGTGVNLKFNHNLAQIEIQGKSSSDVYKFEVTGVKIAQACSKGDFNFGTPAWSNQADKVIYQYVYTTPVVLNATATSLMGRDNGNAMLIPQKLTAWEPAPTAADRNAAKGAYLAVKLKITTKATGVQVYPFVKGAGEQKQESVWAAIPIDTNWQMGKKYTYVLDFSTGAGYVDPTDPVTPEVPILGDPIKFTVNVTDWDDKDNTESKDMKVK